VFKLSKTGLGISKICLEKVHEKFTNICFVKSIDK